jgi:hypothetical protein
MPQQNLDFLSRLPQNMMPQVDFSNIPQLPENFKFNPQMGQMTPGYAVGGPLMGRAANISRQVLSRNAGRNLPDRAMPGIGDRIFGSVYNPRGSLFSAGQQANRIKNTENAIMAGGGLGVATLADGTQMFREPFSEENIGIMSPEAFGRDLAQLRMDVGSVVNLAKNKANEIGADINEYVSRAKQSYEQEMENKRMQEIDAQQGMQPFSMLMGPNMPLSNRDREILGETGRTISDMDRGYIDDILSSLEKKKLDNPPEKSISVKDVTDIFFDPTDPIDYAALAGGPFVKAGLSAKKAKKLYDGLQKIKQQKRQAQTDYRRGQAEYNAGEPQGAKLMSKSQEKFNRLSVNEAKITKQLEGYQPEIL